MSSNVNRILISLDDETLKLIDDYANEFGMTRSGAITSAIKEYVFAHREKDNFMDKTKEMFALIFDKARGKVSPEDFDKQVESYKDYLDNVKNHK